MFDNQTPRLMCDESCQDSMSPLHRHNKLVTTTTVSQMARFFHNQSIPA